jgi:hypothetical protein
MGFDIELLRFEPLRFRGPIFPQEAVRDDAIVDPIEAAGSLAIVRRYALAVPF